MSIPEIIKKFRVQKNLTQADLGEKLGKAPSVIANWEAGTNRPDVNSIGKMLDIFDIDANAFFEWQKAIPDDFTNIGELSDIDIQALEIYQKLPSQDQIRVLGYMDSLLEKDK